MFASSMAFLAAFTLIFFRVPIAIALGVVGFGGFVVLQGLTPGVTMLAMGAKDSSMSYTLSVIPLFVLMGTLIASAGISSDLYRAGQVSIGRRRGGLAMATVLACGGFAAVCGSSVATAMTMAKVSVPSMRKYGYSDELATGCVAAGGTLGILIPPSVVMVIYGIATETHIGKLFAAGLIPGIIGVLGYLAAVQWATWRNPAAGPPGAIATRNEKLEAYRRIWPVVILFGIVLGGIYSGLFTATEAAGIGAFGAFLFAWQRGMNLSKLYDILMDTLQTSAMMFALVLGAIVFAEFINQTGADVAILALVRDNGLSPAMVIFTIMVIYIILGCLLESISMILLTMPLFFPVVVGLGFDPVWFGIFVVVLVELGLITPPIGVNLFVIKSVIPDVPLTTTIKGVLPFIVADLLRIAIIAVFPAVTLFLPNLMFK
jgi:C4-dicarboxylate transporter, DctM subunit